MLFCLCITYKCNSILHYEINDQINRLYDKYNQNNINTMITKYFEVYVVSFAWMVMRVVLAVMALGLLFPLWWVQRGWKVQNTA